MIFFSAHNSCEQQHKAMFLTPGGREEGAGPSYASSSVTKSTKSN